MASGIPLVPSPPQDKGNILRWCGDVWKYLRRSRIIAGSGIRATPTDGGIIISASAKDQGSATADHPFRINGRLNSTGTAVLVTISNGSFEFRTPLFYGSTGDPLSDDPAPEYTISASAGVYYVYFVVTVDKNGLLADAQDVWIEIYTTMPTSVAPVPDDMPDAGDTGTAGTVYIQIGTLTIAVDGSDVTFAAFNDIRQNLTFWMCDGTYTINVIS